MKKGWAHKKLGEVITLNYGKPLPEPHRNPDGNYPVYGANGAIDRSDKFFSDRPSIIVGRKGSAGELNLTESKFWPLDVTYFVTFDVHYYDLRFIYYLLSYLDLPKMAKGVKPGINRNEVYSLDTYIPPLPEQQRIVAILDQAFAAIAKAKENTEKNLKNAREVFESYLNGVFANPGEDWINCRLEDHINFIDYRGKTPEKTSKGLRLITAKNIKQGFLEKQPEEFVDSNIYDRWMTRGIPKRGDILFTTEAPLANVAQLDTDEKVVFAQRVIIFQPERKILNETFLKYLLLSKSIKEKILENGTGATVQGIKSSLLKKIEISFPNTLTEQVRVLKTLDEFSAKSKGLECVYRKKLNDLEELKRSILRKAFN